MLTARQQAHADLDAILQNRKALRAKICSTQDEIRDATLRLGKLRAELLDLEKTIGPAINAIEDQP